VDQEITVRENQLREMEAKSRKRLRSPGLKAPAREGSGEGKLQPRRPGDLSHLTRGVKGSKVAGKWYNNNSRTLTEELSELGIK